MNFFMTTNQYSQSPPTNTYSTISYKNGDFLKIIAIISMLIDHIGFLLYPQLYILRIIGRLSFPIFCVLLGRGFRRTSNRKIYFLRMLLFALISHMPYIFFSPMRLNIFFTLGVGIIILFIYEYSPATAILLPLLAFFTNLQYGAYGLYIILIFYIFREKKEFCIPAYIILNLIHFHLSQSTFQLWSIAFLVIWILEIDIPYRLSKWFGYIFYPAHIAILYLIKIYAL